MRLRSRGLVGAHIDEDRDDQARRSKVQTRPPHGPEHLGPPEEPGEPPRIRPRPARPAPQGQDVRLRHAAEGQAEAQGLLRQHLREAVPQVLRGSHPHEGRLGRQPHRPAGAPPRRCRLSRQVRADAVRRAPVRQPRPREGERTPRQHRLLSREAGRHRRSEGSVQAARDRPRGEPARRARRAGLLSKSITARWSRRCRASRSRPKCPTRSDGAEPRRSSSTRAKSAPAHCAAETNKRSRIHVRLRFSLRPRTSCPHARRTCGQAADMRCISPAGTD